MIAVRHAALLTVVLASAVACGAGAAGTWTDDPSNLARAWGSVPAGVEAVHSWYWRSSHWTREEAYFFALRRNDAFSDAFVTDNGLAPGPRLTAAGVAGLSWDFAQPEWFASRQDTSYESWSRASPADCRVFRDTSTGEWFVYACQL